MTDWHTGKWLHMGIADVEQLPSGALMRKPFVPYVEALHGWQKRLHRVTSLDDDPFDKPVTLEDIRQRRARARPEGRRRLPLAVVGRSSRKLSRALAIGCSRSFCQANASTLAMLVPSRWTSARREASRWSGAGRM